MTEKTPDIHDIVLVDENDTILGYGEKMKIHQQGLLHRAFSLLIFNRDVTK